MEKDQAKKGVNTKQSILNWRNSLQNLYELCYI